MRGAEEAGSSWASPGAAQSHSARASPPPKATLRCMGAFFWSGAAASRRLCVPGGCGTRLHAGFLLAVTVAVLCWIFLYKTTIGYRIRVVGMNPVAAKFAGIDAGKIFVIAFLISGALAGMAGFTEVNGVQHMLVQGFNPTIGAEGIGIAILANANPIGIIFGAILFGALKVGGQILGQTSGIPSSIIEIMEGFVMLFFLISLLISIRRRK